jgi:O-acetylhomoserine/O-acetylserine sulfhydrylase-like pyridoxal-dependent enzyme
VGAICTASGMAAMHLAIATLLGADDHIVASASLYGGTINLLTHTVSLVNLHKLNRDGFCPSESFVCLAYPAFDRRGAHPA